jgi:hypothetical protein
MSRERLNEALAAVETALGSLRLKPASLDADRVIYLAGRASVKGAKGALGTGHVGWVWPLITAASLLLAVTLGAVLLVRTEPQTIERVVYVPVDRPDDSTGREDTLPAARAESRGASLRTDYLALRQLVLTRGIDDALPVAREAAPRVDETLTPRDGYVGSIGCDRRS